MINKNLRRRRRGRALAGIAAIAAVTWFATTLGSGGDPHTIAAFTARSGPVAYRILYRVEVFQDPPSTSFEERLVRRPFDGRILSSTSRVVDPDHVGTSGTMSAGASVLSFGEGHRTVVQQRVPGAAIGDQVLAAVLEEAVRLGYAEAHRDEDVVLGRRCRLFAIKEPGARVVAAPTDSSRTTLCIDDDGLILSERWELREHLVLERTAIALDEDPTVTELENVAEASVTAVPLAMGSTVRSVEQVDSFIEEPPLPTGFELIDRYETVAVDRTRGPSRTSAWVMQDNAAFLVVEAGTGLVSLSGGMSEVPSPLGEGALFLGTMGAEVRVLVDANHWIRVTTSAPPADLARYVARLRSRG